MKILLESLYIMLPAYVANMAPVWVKSIPFLNIPLDFGIHFRGKRIFGDHKTYRGFVAGIIASCLMIFLQWYLYDVPFWHDISLIDYGGLSLFQAILWGFAFGMGALGGDTIKSFFKRQMKIPSGKSWIPFDQLDFVIGTLILIGFFAPLSVIHIGTILVVSPLLHVLMNILGYLIGIRENPI